MTDVERTGLPHWRQVPGYQSAFYLAPGDEISIQLPVLVRVLHTNPVMREDGSLDVVVDYEILGPAPLTDKAVFSVDELVPWAFPLEHLPDVQTD